MTLISKLPFTTFVGMAATCLAFAALTAIPATAQDARSKIVVAHEGDFQPWNFSGPDGTLQGFEVDLAADLSRRIGIPFETVIQPWDGLVTGLAAGQFDAIMSAMSASEEREQVISFSIGYAAYPSTFATLEGNDLLDLPDTGRTFPLKTDAEETEQILDLLRERFKGKTIGVQGASQIAEFINEQFGEVATVREYRTGDEPVLDLLAGRSDVVYAGAVYLSTATKNPGNENLKLTGPVFQPPEAIAVGLPKDAVDLRALFNDAITDAKADGTIRRLSEQWFGIDVTPQ